MRHSYRLRTDRVSWSRILNLQHNCLGLNGCPLVGTAVMPSISISKAMVMTWHDHGWLPIYPNFFFLYFSLWGFRDKSCANESHKINLYPPFWQPPRPTNALTFTDGQFKLHVYIVQCTYINLPDGRRRCEHFEWNAWRKDKGRVVSAFWSFGLFGLPAVLLCAILIKMTFCTHTHTHRLWRNERTAEDDGCRTNFRSTMEQRPLLFELLMEQMP